MGEELLVCEALATLLDNGFETLPDSEKLGAGLKEQVFVEETVIEERASLIPIAEHHSGEGACFCSGGCDSHGVIEAVGEIIGDKPIASLPQASLAAQLVNLQVELGLFVGPRFSSLEALQAATLNPAVYFRQTRDLGTVEVGKIADLVVLEVNP